MLAAMDAAHEVIKAQCELQEELRALAGKPKTEVAKFLPNAEILQAIQEQMGAEIRASIQNPDKAARESAIDDLKREIVARFKPEFPENVSEIPEAADKAVKKAIRSLIIEDSIRPDGRKLDEIRPITCEVGLLPRVHGTGLFTRGQTQVLTAPDARRDERGAGRGQPGSGRERSSTCTSTTSRPTRSAKCARCAAPAGARSATARSRERALVPVLPPLEDFPYAMLLQSEVLESNGSTSMASVCGSTLALMDAGVKIKAPVAGIAMGLMTIGDKYAVLTDIQGMEDFSGDMDFKVAGTTEGITAIQMDTKIQGIPREVMVQALEQARRAASISSARSPRPSPSRARHLSKFAPSIFTIEINPERIGEVIGPGGKMIKQITAETGAQIDIQQDGKIFIAAVDQAAGRRAADIILGMVGDVEVGALFTGKVTRLIGMGAFVEIAPGKEGLVHVSHLQEPAGAPSRRGGQGRRRDQGARHRSGRPGPHQPVGDQPRSAVRPQHGQAPRRRSRRWRPPLRRRGPWRRSRRTGSRRSAPLRRRRPGPWPAPRRSRSPGRPRRAGGRRDSQSPLPSPSLTPTGSHRGSKSRAHVPAYGTCARLVIGEIEGESTHKLTENSEEPVLNAVRQCGLCSSALTIWFRYRSRENRFAIA